MRALVAALFVWFCLPDCAHALGGFLTFGYGKGGTSLKDHTGGQNYNIQAGDGLLISAGVLAAISPTKPHRFETQLGIGYQFRDDASADDKRGSVSWNHIPIDLFYFYRNTREHFRIGYGLTFQFRNRLEAKGTNSTASANFDDAIGSVITIEQLFESGTAGLWGFGLRYNLINYKGSKFGGSVDGDAVFLTMTLLGPSNN